MTPLDSLLASAREATEAMERATAALREVTRRLIGERCRWCGAELPEAVGFDPVAQTLGRLCEACAARQEGVR